MMMRECDCCGVPEERVFRDSYTGMSLCLACVISVAPRVTNSPFTDGDNLRKELNQVHGEHEHE